VRPLRLNNQIVTMEEQEGITGLILIAVLTTLVANLVVAFLEPDLSLIGVLSATLATLYNIGPGLAEVGPTKNFAFLHDGTKLFLSLLMVLGRLEFLALLVLLSPAFWRRY
jgi:trk system potassium uptake protein